MNWSSAIQSLIKQISASEKPKPFQVLRLTVGILPVDLLAFLSAVKTKEKFYWSSRMENFAMAGVGICHEANGIRVADYLNHSTLDLRYLGAISFENKKNDFRFILPQIEIRQVQNQFFLA